MKITPLFMIPLFFFLIFTSQAVLASDSKDVRFSVTAWDESLRSVINNIEQQTGLTIIIDDGIEKDSISGVYNNLTIYDFLSIVLNEGGYTIAKSNNAKTIRIINANKNPDKSGPAHAGQNATKSFLEGESNYIAEARVAYKEISDADKKRLLIDKTTGKSWDEIENQFKSSRNKNFNQLNHDEFLESEAEYTLKAKLAAKKLPKFDSEKIDIDSVSGKPWREIELETMKQ